MERRRNVCTLQTVRFITCTWWTESQPHIWSWSETELLASLSQTKRDDKLQQNHAEIRPCGWTLVCSQRVHTCLSKCGYTKKLQHKIHSFVIVPMCPILPVQTEMIHYFPYFSGEFAFWVLVFDLYRLTTNLEHQQKESHLLKRFLPEISSKPWTGAGITFAVFKVCRFRIKYCPQSLELRVPFGESGFHKRGDEGVLNASLLWSQEGGRVDPEGCLQHRLPLVRQSGLFLVSDLSTLSNYQHELINHFKHYCLKYEVVLGFYCQLYLLLSSEAAGLVLLEDKLGTSTICWVWTDGCVAVRCPSLLRIVLAYIVRQCSLRHWMPYKSMFREK